jgi:hypothetical protein
LTSAVPDAPDATDWALLLATALAPATGRDVDVLGHRRAPRHGGRDLEVTDADDHRILESAAQRAIVDGDVGAARNRGDGQSPHARAQLAHVGLDLDAVAIPGGGFRQIVLERRQRTGVIAQLVLSLADVVEHGSVGRQLIRAPELDQRGAIVGLAVQRNAALKVFARLARGFVIVGCCLGR